MTIQHLLRGAARAAVALIFVAACAATASAQTGQIRGKVVDAKGEPVADATVTISFTGGITRVTNTKSDERGSFIQVGLQPGPYEVTVAKGDLKQTQTTRVPVGAATNMEFVLAAGGGAMSAEDAKALEAKRKELEAKYMSGIEMIDAGQIDEGIAALNAVIAETGGCAICQVKIGDGLWKKGDEAGAEAAYKKAIAADPKLSEAYAQLANLYNKQQKFDAAAEMSKKATEAGGAGGGSASVILNQGIIFWNQGKTTEARAEFEKAVKADPSFAEAHYWLGMSQVSEGLNAEAVKSFEKYLELAPDGQYAETAKQILASIR